VIEHRRIATVLGVDPGGHTGLSVVRWSPSSGWSLLSSEEFPGAADATVTRAATLAHRFLDLKFIAAERFVDGWRSSRLNTSSASVKAHSILGGLGTIPFPLALTSASEWKAWMTRARWAALGFEFPKTKSHDDHKCAAGVAVFLMVRKGFAPDPLKR
jgi:hypothetical protein